MNKLRLIQTFSIMILLLSVVSSCQKDDIIPETPTDKTQREDPVVVEPKLEGVLCKNKKLLNALKRRGFDVKENRLIINDKVKSLKVLDLSDESLTSLDGLENFPALEELNLSDNCISLMDFALLPEHIKSLELQGNIVDKIVNLDPKRKFKKLYLPKSAYFDVQEVLAYYKANKDDVNLDMKYEKNGKLTEYSFLRDVSDDNVRAYMKENYPSIFVGDQIDISKDLSPSEQSKDFILGTPKASFKMKERIGFYESLNGIQFVVGRDEFKGHFSLHPKGFRTSFISYLKFSKNTASVYIDNVVFPDDAVFDLTTAVNAHSFFLGSNVYARLTTLDFSENMALGDPKANGGKGSQLFLFDLDYSINRLKMPKRWEQMKEVKLCFKFHNIGMIDEIDLSRVTAGTDEPNLIGRITLNAKLTKIFYPKNLSASAQKPISFIISHNSRATKAWKNFAEKNQKLIQVSELDEDTLFKTALMSCHNAWGKN